VFAAKEARGMAGLTTLVCPNCGYIAVVGAFEDLGVESIDCARCSKPINVAEATEKLQESEND
jgi:hypothetical protein